MSGHIGYEEQIRPLGVEELKVLEQRGEMMRANAPRRAFPHWDEWLRVTAALIAVMLTIGRGEG